MRFFVPAAEAEKLEDTYASLAKMCRASPPSPDKRIYSIHFVHDGTDWTATVGETLKGTNTRKRTRGGRKVEVTTPVSDPATVLAIFAGNPFMVATTGGIVVRSSWVNPFMAGIPTRVVFFAAP